MNLDRIDTVLAAYYSDDYPELDELVTAGVTVDEMAVVLDTMRLDLEASKATRPTLRSLIDEFVSRMRLDHP